MLLGENGILNITKTAKDQNEKATATETMNLKITNVQMSKYAEEQRMPTLKELADNFCADDDFQYVQETSEVASLTPITNNNPTSIYTKLKAYPYEFEINSSLQLASIDGVKVASNNDGETVSKSDYDQLASLVATLSQKVTNLENNQTSDTTPMGTIIAYYSSTAPGGYIACDGTTYDLTQEDNKKLKSLATFLGAGNEPTSFTAPDLRGEFLRGTGTNATTGYSGVSVRTHQNPTQHLNFGIGSNLIQFPTYTGNSLQATDYDKQNGSVMSRFPTSSVNQGGWNMPSTFTSRPTNTAVLYCIKY